MIIAPRLSPSCIIPSPIIPVEYDDDLRLQNAKYVISVARKLGAVLFMVERDIVEVKPKMIILFVGTLMSLAEELGR